MNSNVVDPAFDPAVQREPEGIGFPKAGERASRYDETHSGERAGRGMTVLHLISSGGLYGAETMVVALCKRLREEGHDSRIGVFHNRHAPNTEVADHAGAAGGPVTSTPCHGRG